MTLRIIFISIKRTLAHVTFPDEKTSKLIFSEPNIEKGKHEIPLLPGILQKIKNHKARQAQEKLPLGEAYHDNDLVFATVEGKPTEPRNFFRLHTKILERAGLPHIKFHTPCDTLLQR
ncbi:hypothetical protein [Desulfofarcimen acetoxidans]|uniref:hypothetical protein n=1 Tax=Desulfofarcimen acetoxidans TaxID=58138 RepID=UPI00019E4CE6|nr:hypothetical protein [Desulfofarcimen acetoxidans]